MLNVVITFKKQLVENLYSPILLITVQLFSEKEEHQSTHQNETAASDLLRSDTQDYFGDKYELEMAKAISFAG